jgi:hypothetical protein
MSNATKAAMARLHAALAKEMETILKEGVTAPDQDGVPVKLTPGAPYLNVIRQFLKDNGIDNPSVGEELDQKPAFTGLPFTQVDPYGPAQ